MQRIQTEPPAYWSRYGADLDKTSTSSIESLDPSRAYSTDAG